MTCARQHVGNQTDEAPTFQLGHGTKTQSIQECEPPTKDPGGNPGRTTGNTTDQSPFRHPTMIRTGHYDVFERTQSGGGVVLRPAGYATVQPAGPMSLRLQLRTGRTTLTY